MATYLLLWNPARWHWWSELDEAFDRRGAGYECNWSSGVNKSIQPGDQVFLMRTGREPRGIIASGTATSHPDKGAHWNRTLRREGKKALYVNCFFDTLLNPAREPILGIDGLRGISKSYFGRTPRSSGTRIPDDIAKVLETQWRRFLKSKRRPLVVADAEAVEGLRTEVVTYVRGRSRVLRDAVLRASAGICECCRVDFSTILDGAGVRALQVHHRRQLASTDKPRVTKSADLAVVCANCHAMIHLNPRKALKVEVLRKRLAADRTRRRRVKA